MEPNVQADWAALCRRGDQGAFLTPYEGSRRLVWTLCRRLLRDPEDVEDAFQATHARLLALARDEGPAAGSQDWSQLVYRCALREADRLRGRRARRRRREIAVETLPPTSATIWGRSRSAVAC
jgi:DNA-directed RNA polymerase specialized sigma24 family protein